MGELHRERATSRYTPKPIVIRCFPRSWLRFVGRDNLHYSSTTLPTGNSMDYSVYRHTDIRGKAIGAENQLTANRSGGYALADLFVCDHTTFEDWSDKKE